MTPTALEDLTNPESAVNILTGRGAIEAALTRWTAGNWIYGDTRGRFLFRLGSPAPEIWEVRVTEPDVQARLFGRFAEPDTLILSKFHTRPYLGKKGSAAWNGAIAAAVVAWESAFGQWHRSPG